VGWVSEGSGVGQLRFVALVCIWVHLCFFSVQCLCQGLSGLGLYKVGIIG
jgi:hypothetical protein